VRTTAARLAAGFVVLLLLGWGVGELWLQIVGDSEADLMREVAAERGEPLVAVARVVTWLGSAYLLVPLALIACAILLRSGLRAQALALALSLGGAMLLSDLIKLLVSRPRPDVEHLQAVAGSSFPSGHSTQASAFWLSLALLARDLVGSRGARWLAAGGALAIVLAVAASRVVLGVHYPSDVIAGVLLGAGWSAFVWRTTVR
jgi:undecaprenyl-diphosphatase